MASMRSIWLRVSSGLIAAFGVIVAVAYPTSCAHAGYVPLGTTCDSHNILRLVIVGVTLVVAALLMALSSPRQAGRDPRTPATSAR